MSFEIRSITRTEALPLFQRYHGYKSMGGVCTYLFGVLERGSVVAAFAWQPPAAGCARSVLPDASYGVLCLSRMVAVPKEERNLRHLSKPLRFQMRNLIDRGRWPALVTFSDEGLGHTGHVYKCSGWKKTSRKKRSQFMDKEGRRTAPYSDGKKVEGLIKVGVAYIQRWEKHAVPPEEAAGWIEANGWQREAIPGKFWSSGNQAYRMSKQQSMPF